MNLMLIHIGPELPSYFWICVDQIRRYYKGRLWLIYEAKLHSSEMEKKYDTHFAPLHQFLDSYRVKEFDEVSFMNDFGMNGFWNVAFQRLFVLERAIEVFELTEVIHIENDIMIYSDPMSLPFQKLKKDRTYITPIGPKFASYAYSYIPSFDPIKLFNDENLKILQRGKETLSEQYGEGMLNEMLIARELLDTNFLDELPILPDGDGSKHFNVFNSLFDPASVGQNLLGIPHLENSQGWKEERHYIGSRFIAGEIVCEWKYEKKKNNWKYPVIVNTKTNTQYKLNSLHVHNKKLELAR